MRQKRKRLNLLSRQNFIDKVLLKNQKRVELMRENMAQNKQKEISLTINEIPQVEVSRKNRVVFQKYPNKVRI